MSREQLNEDARRILGDLAHELAEHEDGESLVEEWSVEFFAKAREYGTMHRVLGIRAQFVDIHRKVGKLERAWWEDADTSGWREQPREIAMDLIGHLFLAIAMIDREDNEQAELLKRYEEKAREAVQRTDVMRGVGVAEMTLGGYSSQGRLVKANCNDNSDSPHVFCQRAMGHDGWHSNKEGNATRSWGTGGTKDFAVEPEPGWTTRELCGEGYVNIEDGEVTCELPKGHEGGSHSGWSSKKGARMGWFQ